MAMVGIIIIVFVFVLSMAVLCYAMSLFLALPRLTPDFLDLR